MCVCVGGGVGEPPPPIFWNNSLHRVCQRNPAFLKNMFLCQATELTDAYLDFLGHLTAIFAPGPIGLALMCLIKPGCFHFASEAPVIKVENHFKVCRLFLLNIEYRLKALERPVRIQTFVRVSFAFKNSNFHSCAI